MKEVKPARSTIRTDPKATPISDDGSVTTLGFNLNRWIQGLSVRQVRLQGEGVVNVVTSPDGSQPPAWIDPVYGEDTGEEVIEGLKEEDETIGLS